MIRFIVLGILGISTSLYGGQQDQLKTFKYIANNINNISYDCEAIGMGLVSHIPAPTEPLEKYKKCKETRSSFSATMRSLGNDHLLNIVLNNFTNARNSFDKVINMFNKNDVIWLRKTNTVNSVMILSQNGSTLFVYLNPMTNEMQIKIFRTAASQLYYVRSFKRETMFLSPESIFQEVQKGINLGILFKYTDLQLLNYLLETLGPLCTKVKNSAVRGLPINSTRRDIEADFDLTCSILLNKNLLLYTISSVRQKNKKN